MQGNVAEVANYASNTAEQTQAVDEDAKQGLSIVDASMQNIYKLGVVLPKLLKVFLKTTR